MAEEHAALRFTRRYPASLDEVWRALTEPESLSHWLGPPDDVDARMRTIEPGRVLEIDWTRRGESDSLVRFELASEPANQDGFARSELRILHRSRSELVQFIDEADGPFVRLGKPTAFATLAHQLRS